MLTATQTKYATGRVEAIYRRKREKLDALAASSRKRTIQEHLELLMSGEFSVKSPDQYPYYANWYQAVEFPKPEQAITPAALKTAQDALTVERDAIIDELVLGDAEGALAAIKRFEESPDGLAE